MNKELTTENLIVIVITLSALIISIIALVYTIRAFWLKQGLKIRGSYSTCSSITCEDVYVSEVILENMKDRAVAIYHIYLRLGYNYYILIEGFPDKPLTLKPFEAYVGTYGSIDSYVISKGKIHFNHLIRDKKVKKSLVLSTSEGRYVINQKLIHWNPIVDFFKNYFTAIVHIRRINFEGNFYGGNTKYIIVLKRKDGNEEIFPIYPRKGEIQKFTNFQLSKDNLENKDQLEEALYNQLGVHDTEYMDLSVYDYEEWKKEKYNFGEMKEIKAHKYSFIQYFIIGPLYTRISNLKLKRDNKRNRKNPTGR